MNGAVIRSIGSTEARELVASGIADDLGCKCRKCRQKPPEKIRLRGPRTKNYKPQANITLRELEGNAQGHRRAMRKVKAWPKTHDMHAVTVHAGPHGSKIWVPSEKAAAERAKEVAEVRKPNPYCAPTVGGGWLTAKDVKKIAEAELARAEQARN